MKGTITNGSMRTERDKQKHRAYSAGIELAIFLVALSVLTYWWALLAGVVGSLLVGAAKELRDLITRKGNPEWADMRANAEGIVAMAVVIALVGLIFNL